MALRGQRFPGPNGSASVFASLQPGSEADQTQRCPRMLNAVTESSRDVRRSRASKQPDGQVAQGSHGLGPGSFSNLGAIFVEGDIPYPVQAILDPPVAPVESEKPAGRSLRRTQARYTEDHLVAHGGAVELRGDSFDPKDLLGVREVQVARELSTRPQSAHLHPTVPLVDRRLLRGEKPRAAAVRYRPEVSAGCPSL